MSSAIEKTIPDKTHVRVQRKASESLPIPLPSTISDKLIDTSRSAEPEKHSPSDATEPESQTPSYVSYYPSSQLTTRPVPLNDVMLGPAEMAFVAATGTLVLTLWVNELGEVAEVAVETPDLPEEIASGLVSAFKQLRFTPGELSDQKVGVVMQIEVSVN